MWTVCSNQSMNHSSKMKCLEVIDCSLMETWVKITLRQEYKYTDKLISKLILHIYGAVLEWGTVILKDSEDDDGEDWRLRLSSKTKRVEMWWVWRPQLNHPFPSSSNLSADKFSTLDLFCPAHFSVFHTNIRRTEVSSMTRAGNLHATCLRSVSGCFAGGFLLSETFVSAAHAGRNAAIFGGRNSQAWS